MTRARTRVVGKEKMLQRRVGQEDAEPGNAGGDSGAMPLLLSTAREHDGTSGGLEQRFFFGSERTEGAGGGDVANHDGERFAVAVLALA